jgi:hypothetical protein
MKRFTTMVFAALVAVVLSVPAFAQTPAPATKSQPKTEAKQSKDEKKEAAKAKKAEKKSKKQASKDKKEAKPATK